MRKTLLGAAALFLAACGTPVPNGTVVDMYRQAPYTSYYESCFAYKNGMCTQSVQMPRFHSEKWTITLENCDLMEDGDDSCPQQRFNVDRDVFDSLDIGDYYDTESND